MLVVVNVCGRGKMPRVPALRVINPPVYVWKREMKGEVAFEIFPLPT